MSTFEELAARMPYGDGVAPAAGITPPADHPEDLAARYVQHMAAGRPTKPAPGTPALQGEESTPHERLTARTDDQLAADFYAKPEPVKLDVPEAVRADRATRGAPTYDKTVHPDLHDGFSKLDGMPEHARMAVGVEATRILEDIGCSDTDSISDFRTALNELHAENAPAQEALQANAWRALQAEYGDHAESALRAAQALAKRDPRFTEYLNESGAGDHPRIVLRLAREGLRQRADGRLE